MLSDLLKTYTTDQGRKRVVEVAELASARLNALGSTVASLLEPHLRKLRARLESGDPRMYYILTGVAASIAAIISILIVVLISRMRGSSTGKSVGTAVGLEALDWFQARVASPYSTLYEGLVKASPFPSRNPIGDSTGLEAEGQTSLRGYLITRFAKMP